MGSKLPQMERVSKILRKITCHSHVATVVHIVDGSLFLAGFFENLEECSLTVLLNYLKTQEQLAAIIRFGLVMEFNHHSPVLHSYTATDSYL